MKKNRKKKITVDPGRLLAGLAFFLLIRIAAGQDLGAAGTPFGTTLLHSLAAEFAAILYDQFLPEASFSQEEGTFWIVESGAEEILPLYGMARREAHAAGDGARNAGTAERQEKGRSAVLKYDMLTARGTEWEEPALQGEDEDLQELFRAENEAAAESGAPVRHSRRLVVDLDELRDYETLVKTFYTIDANTMAGSDQLNVDRLLGRDMTVDAETDGPQILIYHTHSQEAFADSVPGDASTGIMGVGERLAEVLRTQYGYDVLHHTGQYDVESRDNAYGNALPDLERVLAEHPSIQVVIDLHRDQMPETTRLAMNLDGKPTARFMFFNGLSRTRKTGDIAYLKNENIDDNLAFSFQMQLKAEEYYPGLARKIYLKGYRYNMHVCPKTLLIELGAQNNTVEEAMNACEPLAHVLDLVIGGARAEG